MKKLTKKQRHNLFIKSLESFRKAQDGSLDKKLCNCIRQNSALSYSDILENTEISLFLNPDSHLFKMWYESEYKGNGLTTDPKHNEHRETILCFCIQMTK